MYFLLFCKSIKKRKRKISCGTMVVVQVRDVRDLDYGVVQKDEKVLDCVYSLYIQIIGFVDRFDVDVRKKERVKNDFLFLI